MNDNNNVSNNIKEEETGFGPLVISIVGFAAGGIILGIISLILINKLNNRYKNKFSRNLRFYGITIAISIMAFIYGIFQIYNITIQVMNLINDLNKELNK